MSKDAILSAKTGGEVAEAGGINTPDNGNCGGLDFSRLLGFSTLARAVDGAVDFQEATFSAKLGAKVGEAA